MTDGIELNGGQSEITEMPSSESQNELVESHIERFLFEMNGEIQPRRKTRPPIVTTFLDLYGLLKDTKLSKQKSKGTRSDQNLVLLIPMMSLFAGAAYMVLFSFLDAFLISAEFKGVVNLSILELLIFPKTATDDFLVIATVTTTFMLSMGMNTIAICIFFRGTFLTIPFLSTIVAFSFSFFAMLSKFFPHHITIAGGNLKIPATAIVIFYDFYAIILVCAFAYTVQLWWSSRRKQDAVTEPPATAKLLFCCFCKL